MSEPSPDRAAPPVSAPPVPPSAWEEWKLPLGLLALTFLVLGFTKSKALGLFIGGIFVITLIISAITGGNMFQAWNVADITFTYFQIPQAATGVVLTILVGLVIPFT